MKLFTEQTQRGFKMSLRYVKAIHWSRYETRKCFSELFGPRLQTIL